MRRSKEPLQKVTINLFVGDFQRLGELYPLVGATNVIRELVRTHLRKIDEQVHQKVSTAELPLEHHE